MDINFLVKVTSRAWALDILALLHAGTPGRQATLIAASGAGRTAFAQSLQHLIDLGLIERNPGHGHPLRPEFVLTMRGAKLAKIAGHIISAVVRSPERVLLRRSWTVPILMVAQKPRHFGEFRNVLGTISDRALSQSLKRLQGQKWLERKVDVDFRPPRVSYQASKVGALICNVAA